MTRVVELDEMGVEQEVSSIQGRQVSRFPEATGEIYFFMLVQRAIQHANTHGSWYVLMLLVSSLRRQGFEGDVVINHVHADIAMSRRVVYEEPHTYGYSLVDVAGRGRRHNLLQGHAGSQAAAAGRTVSAFHPLPSGVHVALYVSLSSGNAVSQSGSISQLHLSMDDSLYRRHGLSVNPAVDQTQLEVEIVRMSRLSRELGAFRAPRVMAEEGNVPNEQAKQRRLSR